MSQNIPGNKAMESLLPLVEKIPAFPQSVSRVLSLSSDINCPTRELVEVVSNDPVLTLKILRLVNSAFFGLATPVTSIRQALVTLGMNTLKNTALSLALIGVLPRENEAELDMDRFWLHCLAVGLAARRLARAMGLSRSEAEDHFVAGLLHDVGKLVLARYQALAYRSVLETVREDNSDLHEAEKTMLDATHCEVGALLAERWGLPDPLARCLAWHHDPDGDPSPMGDTVFAADQLVKRLRLGFSGNPAWRDFPEALADRLDLDTEKALTFMPGLQEELDAARAMIEA